MVSVLEYRRVTRRGAARLYHVGLRRPDVVDWSLVNAAILGRWSVRSLDEIKRLAWTGRCWDEAER